MLRFRSLASSSAGNATLVEASDGLHRTRVLIDCGLGWRQLLQRLDATGVSGEQIDGIFLTHEHGDHAGCALTASARLGIPLWTSTGTWEAIGGDSTACAVHLCSDGEPVAIGALQLRPFTVPHDAREPLQITCTDGARTLGILTDLGHCPPHVLANLTQASALMLESNHDPELLARSRYPDFLKQRVGGRLGHLSNTQAAHILSELHHPGLHAVVASHLSERNNKPELARQALASALGCNEDEVLVTSRDGLGWITA